MTLHWSVIPPAHCGPESAVLEYRAAQYEREQAERDFMKTDRGTLEAWSASNYMESAFQAEGSLYWPAAERYGQ
ncbi:hypothetical protein ACIP79_00835 [Streptomyces sp. NPDC088747]|uniref:hypothetical protein n=1 Tax=Streptomyces sp. NPDC088747 TaxID=3365886 RepID=UPI003807498B